MAGLGGIIMFIGLIGFVSLAFLAKYINPSLRLYSLTIKTYLGLVLLAMLVSMTIIYPKVYGLEVEAEKSDKRPLYEFPTIWDIPEDYLVETFELADPVDRLDVQIADNASMWMNTPEFFVKKEAGREVVTIYHYASPIMYNNIVVGEDKSTLRLKEAVIEYDVGEPLKIKRSFNRIVHDDITKQFFGTEDVFTDWAEFHEAENSFLIMTPEDTEITHEQDIFYIDYLDEEE